MRDYSLVMMVIMVINKNSLAIIAIKAMKSETRHTNSQ